MSTIFFKKHPRILSTPLGHSIFLHCARQVLTHSAVSHILLYLFTVHRDVELWKGRHFVLSWIPGPRTVPGTQQAISKHV